MYAADEIEVRETDGLKFHYSRGRLALFKSVVEGIRFRTRLGQQIERLAADFRRDRPDMVLSDFEPTVARAAHRCGVPVMSLDHQHFLLCYDLSALPWNLRLYANSMRPFVRLFGIGQQRTVISAFYFPPLRPGCEDVVQVGPLLRSFVRQTKPIAGDHLLCYLRRHTPVRVLDLLVELDLPLRIYGLGDRAPQGKAIFRPIHETQFVEDLATSRGVIAAAGNQLLGESLFFRKPFLAIPERKHYEQRINAHFLKLLGGGEWVTVDQLRRTHLSKFIDALPHYRDQLRRSPHTFDGTDAAVQQIETFLEGLGAGD